LNFFPIEPWFLRASTRLRDFLGALFDAGLRQDELAARPQSSVSREDWISQQIASHWRERDETLERCAGDRWLRIAKRRLPNGFGICVISDVSEERKREEQWRTDLERVKLTEDILDHLPFPLFVKDRQMTYVAVNRAFCDKYQTAADDVLGRKGEE